MTKKVERPAPTEIKKAAKDLTVNRALRGIAYFASWLGVGLLFKGMVLPAVMGKSLVMSAIEKAVTVLTAGSLATRLAKAQAPHPAPAP